MPYGKEEKLYLPPLIQVVGQSNRQAEIIRKYHKIGPKVQKENEFYNPNSTPKRPVQDDRYRKVDDIIQKYNPAYRPPLSIDRIRDYRPTKLSNRSSSNKNESCRYEDLFASRDYDVNPQIASLQSLLRGKEENSSKLKNSPSYQEIASRPPWWG